MVYFLSLSVLSGLFLIISWEDGCLNHQPSNVSEQMDGFSKVKILTETLVGVKNLRWVKPICQYYELLPFVTFSFEGPFSCNIRSSNPITGLDRPIGFQEVEAPRFQDNQHMKAVKLSALRAGRLYPPGIIPGTHSC
jgi:hypothetical protein